MDQRKKSVLRYFSALAPMALIGIIWGTIDFGTLEDPFIFTLSKIGNRFTHRFDFIIWGISTGSLFLFYLYYTYKLTGFQNKRALHLLILSDVSLILCVLFPSLREEWPLLYHLHTLSATIFVVTLLLSILLFIAYLDKIDKTVTKRSLLSLLMVVGGSVLSLFFHGKTGMFEITFIISLAIFLMFLNYWIRALEKKNKLEPSDNQPSSDTDKPASTMLPKL